MAARHDARGGGSEVHAFSVRFADGQERPAAEVQTDADVGGALAGLELETRPVVVVVGGAAGLDETDGLSRLFDDIVVPAIERAGAAAVDGATDSGVMRMLGRAHARSGSAFPLIGVAATGTVAMPGEAPRKGAAPLEQHHTHFLLVPGSRWGDESRWIDVVAAELSRGRASLTLLVNGGDVSREDVERSLSVGRPVLVAQGTGRVADELAEEVRDGELTRWTGNGLLRAIDPSKEPGGFLQAFEEALAEEGFRG